MTIEYVVVHQEQGFLLLVDCVAEGRSQGRVFCAVQSCLEKVPVAAEVADYLVELSTQELVRVSVEVPLPAASGRVFLKDLEEVGTLLRVLPASPSVLTE